MAVDNTGDIFGNYDTYMDNDIIMTVATWDLEGAPDAAFIQQEGEEDSAIDDYESALADLEHGLEAERTIGPDPDANTDAPPVIDNHKVSPEYQPLRL